MDVYQNYLWSTWVKCSEEYPFICHQGLTSFSHSVKYK